MLESIFINKKKIRIITESMNKMWPKEMVFIGAYIAIIFVKIVWRFLRKHLEIEQLYNLARQLLHIYPKGNEILNICLQPMFVSY